MRGWIIVAALAPAAAALGQEFDWVTVGDPGNRATLPHEVPWDPDLRLGAVDYEYRITRTEITTEQWFEFVQAYAPYWDGVPWDPHFTSWWIEWDPATQSHYIEPGRQRHPAEMSWRVAARYANWLHNGRSSEPWAFEEGAYDTSTFTQNPDGTYNDQPRHDPDARFWISTNDEWNKAIHYDPDRYGPGEEGYWLYPDGGDEPLIPGYPWEGGETNAGIPLDGDLIYLPVGSYPHVTSPWGLLDGSGGVREWTEDWYMDYPAGRV